MTRLAVGIREAADMAGVSDKVIRAAVHRLELPARRLNGPGSRILIRVADLESWLDGLEAVQ